MTCSVYLLVGAFFLATLLGAKGEEHYIHKWLINNPRDFHNRSAHLGDGLHDCRENEKEMEKFVNIVNYFLPRVDGFTDGEVVDALEHFFWGQENGLAIELGALDGSVNTKSQTFEYEKTLKWRRILVEGDPTYKANLLKESSQAFIANAAICADRGLVHFSDQAYTGGILEFMSDEFFRTYHFPVYKSGVPPGNLSSIDFTKHAHVKTIDCIPMSLVLHKAHVRHVNYFVLDVEGAEMQVLNSINWSLVKFDVLCIETDPPNRPKGYAEEMTAFLKKKGYENKYRQIGRNIWYTHQDFEPMARPGLATDCFNGARKSDHAERWWANRRTPAFQACPMDPKAVATKPVVSKRVVSEPPAPKEYS
eukprot:gene11205-13044_t